MSWDPHLPLDQQPDAKFRYAPWVLMVISIIAVIAALLLA